MRTRTFIYYGTKNGTVLPIRTILRVPSNNDKPATIEQTLRVIKEKRNGRRPAIRMAVHLRRVGLKPVLYPDHAAAGQPFAAPCKRFQSGE